MILQALTRCYEDLLQRGEIAAPGWSPAKISFALCLDADGRLTQVIPTMQETLVGKKTVLRPQSITLPAAAKRPAESVQIFCGKTLATCWESNKERRPRAARSALTPQRICITPSWMAWIPPSHAPS